MRRREINVDARGQPDVPAPALDDGSMRLTPAPVRRPLSDAVDSQFELDYKPMAEPAQRPFDGRRTPQRENAVPGPKSRVALGPIQGCSVIQPRMDRLHGLLDRATRGGCQP